MVGRNTQKQKKGESVDAEGKTKKRFALERPEKMEYNTYAAPLGEVEEVLSKITGKRKKEDFEPENLPTPDPAQKSPNILKNSPMPDKNIFVQNAGSSPGPISIPAKPVVSAPISVTPVGGKLSSPDPKKRAIPQTSVKLHPPIAASPALAQKTPAVAENPFEKKKPKVVAPPTPLAPVRGKNFKIAKKKSDFSTVKHKLKEPRDVPRKPIGKYIVLFFLILLPVLYVLSMAPILFFLGSPPPKWFPNVYQPVIKLSKELPILQKYNQQWVKQKTEKKNVQKPKKLRKKELRVKFLHAFLQDGLFKAKAQILMMQVNTNIMKMILRKKIKRNIRESRILFTELLKTQPNYQYLKQLKIQMKDVILLFASSHEKKVVRKLKRGDDKISVAIIKNHLEKKNKKIKYIKWGTPSLLYESIWKVEVTYKIPKVKAIKAFYYINIYKNREQILWED